MSDNLDNENRYVHNNCFNNIDPTNNFNLFRGYDQHCNYYDPDNLHINNNINPASFSLLHINARSLHNSIDNINSLLGLLNHQFSIIGITETWIPSHATPTCNLDGYTLELKGRNHTRGGGVGFYINNSIQYTTLPDISIFSEGCFESIFIECSSHNNLVFGVIYRPPNGNIDHFHDMLDQLLHKLSNKCCYIMGDFNIDLLKSNSNSFSNIFNSYFFRNFITKPTRVSPTSKTLIDNIFSNSSAEVVNSGIITYDISDHFPIFHCFDINITSNNHMASKSLTYFRPISPNKLTNFITLMSHETWESLYDDKNPESTYSTFIRIFTQHYYNCFPRMLYKKRKMKSWCSSGIINSCSTKQKLYKRFIRNSTNDNRETYIRFRNRLNSVIRSAKRLHYSSLLQGTDTKDYWSTLNSIIKPNSKNVHSMPSSISYNDNIISDPNTICSIFNDYFATIGANLSSSINMGPTHFSDYLPDPNPHSFYMNPVTVDEISLCILNLKDSSPGHDEISAKVVKSVLPYIVKPLTHIFNCSLLNGIIPSPLKTARVSPIFKNNDKQCIGNYRPISVLPCFSKILERIVYNRLYSFLVKHNALYKHQYGFLPGKSTSHAIIHLTDMIVNSFENNELSCGVFLDLSKAFDTLDHDIIISKLSCYGIRGMALDWFKNYLSDRNQYVSNSNFKSSLKHITTGVPQGSILGPLLFILYINDLPNCSSLCSFTLYADDTSLIYSGIDINSIISDINTDMPNIINWFTCNKLHLNSKKTVSIMFHHRQKSLILNDNGVKIGSHLVPFSNKTKFLGVIIDQNISWTSHIDYICEKASKSIGILYKIKDYIPKRCLISIYNALILPFFSYGTIIWGFTFPTHVSRIHILQKRALRIICNEPYMSPSMPLFKNCNTLTIFDIAYFQVAVFMFQYSKGTLLANFNSFFIYRDHNYSIRCGDRIYPYFCKLTSSQKFIKYLGPNIWNSVPDQVKSSHTLSSFKYSLKMYLLSKYLIV